MSATQQPSGQPYGTAPQQYAAPAPYGQAPAPYAQPHAAVAYAQHVPAGYGAPLGPVGKIRSTWAVIGLSIITLGIYGLFYYYATHEEMKRHSGEGLGGALGLILGIVTLGLVTLFALPNEVGHLYARQGRPRPVTATTGLWVLFPFIGSLIWLIKTNGALNAYWRSLGAR